MTQDFPTPAVSGRRRARRVVVSVLGVLLVLLAVSGAADRQGAEQVEAGFQRSLVAFGIARTLNGVISVVQNTGVSFQPAGVGVTLAPGQVLDPVNDLVERFSWVMLVSGTSFGIQRLLLEILASPGVSLALALLVALLLAASWQEQGVLARRRAWLLRVTLFVALARFAVPVLAISGEALHELFMADRYVEAVTGLEETAVTLGELAEEARPATAADPTLAERLRQWYTEAGAALDVEARIDEYRALAARAAEQALDLIVVFTFQTVVLPLLFIWLVVLAYRTLVRAWRDAVRP